MMPTIKVVCACQNATSLGRAASTFGAFPEPPPRREFGKLEGALQPPPELSSAARNPTTAKRTHWPKRNGWNSCFLACSIAGLTASVAESGKVYLKVLKVLECASKVNGRLTLDEKAQGM